VGDGRGGFLMDLSKLESVLDAAIKKVIVIIRNGYVPEDPRFQSRVLTILSEELKEIADEIAEEGSG
jgi:hypothetical protein